MNALAPLENQDCDLAIVDDDELTLKLLERVLRNSNCDARFFSTGELALDFLQNHHTRLLLIDNRMPGMSGLELLRKLSKLGTHVADTIYLCSATAMPEEVICKANDLGANVMLKDVYRNQTDLLALLH